MLQEMIYVNDHAHLIHKKPRVLPNRSHIPESGKKVRQAWKNRLEKGACRWRGGEDKGFIL